MKEYYQSRMLELAKRFSKQDREQMREELNISAQTLNNYLSGDIVKIDLADRIMEYMESKIKEKSNTTANINA